MICSSDISKSALDLREPVTGPDLAATITSAYWSLLRLTKAPLTSQAYRLIMENL